MKITATYQTTEQIGYENSREYTKVIHLDPEMKLKDLNKVKGLQHIEDFEIHLSKEDLDNANPTR